MKSQLEKCFACGNEQEINDKNVWQDIKGKYTICEKCGATYDVEPKDEY